MSADVEALLHVAARLLTLAQTFRAAGVLADGAQPFLPDTPTDQADVWNTFADELTRLRADVLAACDGGEA